MSMRSLRVLMSMHSLRVLMSILMSMHSLRVLICPCALKLLWWTQTALYFGVHYKSLQCKAKVMDSTQSRSTPCSPCSHAAPPAVVDDLGGGGAALGEGGIAKGNEDARGHQEGEGGGGLAGW